ncbi:MAG: hypothetical protein ACLRPX_04130 [Ruthenibacterium sp.]
MSTEIGAKKQRNWLLDFLRIPAGFCIAINHFMQRWCDSLESVYDSGVSYFTQKYVFNDGFTAGGYYCLGFFTFLSGYWFIDWYKKQQRAGLLGRGKDAVLLWKYWGKTYSSYVPYIWVGGLLSLLGTMIMFRVPLAQWVLHLCNTLPELLGFGEFGFTVPQAWMTVVKHLATDPTWTPSVTQPFLLGAQFWYLSTLICYATALMACFVVSEKVGLFIAGPYFMMMCVKTNWTSEAMNDVVSWNINRMFGPMFIGVYAWYLIDYLKNHPISPKVQKAINIGAVCSFIGYGIWRTVWTDATFIEGDTMWCLVCFFTILNQDAFTKALNRFFNKISFISKHFASVGAGVMFLHYVILNTLMFLDVKGMIPWFTEAYGGVKFTVYVLIVLASGILFIPIDKYICKPASKWLANLLGSRKPVVIEENAPKEILNV